MRCKRVRTPIMIQMEVMECGAAALGSVLGYYGKFLTLEELRVECGISRDGTSIINLLKAAEKFGLAAKALKKQASELFDFVFPAILFWEFKHFVVLEGFGKKGVYLNDPCMGPRRVSYEEFQRSFSGVILCFEKTAHFVKEGSPPSLFQDLRIRFKGMHNPFRFLFFTGCCLLVPNIVLVFSLVAIVDTVFSRVFFPWKGEYIQVIVLIACFTGILTWMQQYVMSRLNQKLSMRFSSEFLWHLFKLPTNFYSQRHASEVACRIGLNDTIAEILTGPVTSAVINMVLVVFYALIMFSIDIAIASIGCVFGVLNLIVAQQIFKSGSIERARLQPDLAKSIAQSLGILQNMEVVKVKGIESKVFSRWAGAYTNVVNSIQVIEKNNAGLSSMPVLLQSLAVAALLWIGSVHIIQGSLTPGKLIGLQLLLVSFFLPTNSLVGLSTQVQMLKLHLQRLNDVTKNKVDSIYLARRSKKDTKLKLMGELEFQNVTFQYAPLSPPAIKNISFTIRPGKWLALVGAAGSGKSTISKLAMGLFYPTSGKILYNGVPLENISVDLFRNSVASVNQEIFLFSGTIRNNLTFWNDQISDEVLFHAAQDAAIHDEISMRDKGYNSLLSEGGRNMSGGERQRLEIARAFLYEPSILILDEATSALDSKTEQEIVERIRQRGCSVLMIAHRLSTIRDCDEIIVLDQGCIVQRGTHEELKQISGVYQALVESEGSG
ncbi:MAG: ATP-binding cassette domain-containing protein [Simkania sp.]|nr:ATP-binding cassette domain-containing protein [Simkania sp.]